VKTAKQSQMESDIKAINAKISVKSSSIGQRLRDDDPLIEERQRLFRALQAEKDAGLPPQSGGGSSHP